MPPVFLHICRRHLPVWLCLLCACLTSHLPPSLAVPARCLCRYARADELKIKELTLQLEKVTNAMTERRAEVEMEVRHPLA